MAFLDDERDDFLVQIGYNEFFLAYEAWDLDLTSQENFESLLLSYFLTVSQEIFHATIVV